MYKSTEKELVKRGARGGVIASLAHLQYAPLRRHRQEEKFKSILSYKELEAKLGYVRHSTGG